MNAFVFKPHAELSETQAPQSTIDLQREFSRVNERMRLIISAQESDAREIQTKKPDILGRASCLSTFCFLKNNTLPILM